MEMMQRNFIYEASARWYPGSAPLWTLRQSIWGALFAQLHRPRHRFLANASLALGLQKLPKTIVRHCPIQGSLCVAERRSVNLGVWHMWRVRIMMIAGQRLKHRDKKNDITKRHDSRDVVAQVEAVQYKSRVAGKIIVYTQKWHVRWEREHHSSCACCAVQPGIAS
jgi:hypothetical protein